MLLDPADLATITGYLAANAYPATATVSRPAASEQGGTGGRRTTPPTTFTAPVRVEQLPGTSNQEAVVGEIRQAVVKWLLAFPAGTVIQADDSIAVAGQTFAVSAPLIADSIELEVAVQCVEVKP